MFEWASVCGLVVKGVDCGLQVPGLSVAPRGRVFFFTPPPLYPSSLYPSSLYPSSPWETSLWLKGLGGITFSSFTCTQSFISWCFDPEGSSKILQNVALRWSFVLSKTYSWVSGSNLWVNRIYRKFVLMLSAMLFTRILYMYVCVDNLCAFHCARVCTLHNRGWRMHNWHSAVARVTANPFVWLGIIWWNGTCWVCCSVRFNEWFEQNCIIKAELRT